MPEAAPDPTEDERVAALFAAEARALAMLDAIEAAGLIAAGRSESEIERDIYALARRDFGVTRHWHKRIVRAGLNTLSTYSADPPDRVVADDDMVFIDLGPVFAKWEADVGRSYAVGGDPRKHALCAALPVLFDTVKARFDADPDITGAALYAFAHEAAGAAGWRFGGTIAGHIVDRFPHRRPKADRNADTINAANRRRLRDPDELGQVRHWILEIHLVSPDRSFGGFYERLMEGKTSSQSSDHCDRIN